MTWLTVAEAVEHIRATDATILRRAIKDGELPAYTYGKAAIRLKVEEVDAWLAGRPFEPRSA
jgi:excisionase family DNA binding protein